MIKKIFLCVSLITCMSANLCVIAQGSETSRLSQFFIFCGLKSVVKGTAVFAVLKTANLDRFPRIKRGGLLYAGLCVPFSLLAPLGFCIQNNKQLNSKCFEFEKRVAQRFKRSMIGGWLLSPAHATHQFPYKSF